MVNQGQTPNRVLLHREPPYGSTEGALKDVDQLAIEAGQDEPPYGSTEGALKGRAYVNIRNRGQEPPYGSTEGALKEERIRLSISVSVRTTIRLYRGSTESRSGLGYRRYRSGEPPYGSTEGALKERHKTRT